MLNVTADLSRTLIYPGHDQMVVYVLIDLKKGQVTSSAVVSTLKRKLKFCIDRSGSMAEEHKLEIIKKALVQYIPELDDKDEVSIDVFDDEHDRSQVTVVVQNNRDAILKAISGLKPGDYTMMSGALAQAVLANDPAYYTKAVVLGDGLLNRGGPGEDSKCVKIMGKPEAVPAVIIGLGSGYNEKLFSQMANKGKPGTYYRHVTDATELYDILHEEFQLFQSVTGDVKDITVDIGGRNGAVVTSAVIFIPDQQDLAIVNGPINWNVTHEQPFIDALGQKLLIGLTVPARTLFTQGGNVDIQPEIVEILVRHFEGGVEVVDFSEKLSIGITGDQDRVKASPANPTVMQTIAAYSMTMHTMKGEYDKAQTIAKQAGFATAAAKLEQITSGKASENDMREVRTMTRLAGRTELNDLSS